MAHQTAVFQLGTTDPVAEDVQGLLKAAGYKVDNMKGHVTKAFIATLKQFQKDSILKPSGNADNDTLDALEYASSCKPPECQVDYNRHAYLLTRKEYMLVSKRSCRAILKGLYRDLEKRADTAEDIWYYWHKKNKNQYVVGFIMSQTFGRPIPDQSVVIEAGLALGNLKAVLTSNDMKKIVHRVERAEFHVNFAIKVMQEYEADMISGTAKAIKALEFTKTASFTFLQCVATPGPVGMGVGAVLKYAGASAGLTAVEALSTEAGKAFAGTSGGFRKAATNMLSDMLISGAVSAFTGSKQSERFFGWLGKNGRKLIGKNANKMLNDNVLGIYMAKYVKASASTALDGAVEDGLKLTLKDPDKMTWEKFYTHLGTNLVYGGAFKEFENFGEYVAGDFVKNMDKKTKATLLEGLNVPKGKENELLVKMMDKTRQSLMEKQFMRSMEAIVSHASGREKPKDLQKKAMQRTFDKKTMTELNKQAKKLQDAGKLK
ncbi:peptidoglycan-binding domain-containing protein [Phaeobacter gallaeciensis]|uniref:peptidoglycan-binding domain-containing protein n=1 Tax=Phaeobacter gallaeciensis TaxID=60890 RepID=UPI00237FA4C3|nr:peptidoglycan-binding domain-containing protein [Phaeobacter gallaeciensis]MDE4100056.1 peptidoglycan-binding domain-containing protein [Phaeobacter gallaeciensis]MDE4108903.1 peptidoglycan-binding domain-containing protein [Phaeobacter gallaeciensis]MDE4113349.1 peptidoglycan-binding domain-containing protein [Phaeobacter gallaeciensis]MDE4117763.1 peptidoglycan-binding domain-containing protein [Phaeobacter gallaeciensis]MDE4122266.1 peptidoglycan-binding domain-containing protein [Phaeob